MCELRFACYDGHRALPTPSQAVTGDPLTSVAHAMKKTERVLAGYARMCWKRNDLDDSLPTVPVYLSRSETYYCKTNDPDQTCDTGCLVFWYSSILPCCIMATKVSPFAGRMEVMFVLLLLFAETKFSDAPGEDYLFNVEGNNTDNKLKTLGVNVDSWGFGTN